MGEKQPAKSMAGCIVMAAIVAIAALYPLSAGPVVMLRNRDTMSDARFMQLYAPLIWVDDHLLSEYRPFGSYVNLWADLRETLSTYFAKPRDQQQSRQTA